VQRAKVFVHDDIAAVCPAGILAVRFLDAVSPSGEVFLTTRTRSSASSAIVTAAGSFDASSTTTTSRSTAR
jgi:hypothetical protein